MDRIHNSAHAQFTGSAIHRVVQQYGSSNHRVDRTHTFGHDAIDIKTAQANEGYERPTAQAKRDSRPIRQRPLPNLSRDHALVPRGRGKPDWLSRSYDHPDACLDRSLQSIDPDCILKARRSDRTFGKIILMDPTFIDLLCRSFEFKLPLAGSRPIRSNQSDNACVGLRYHLGSAENDHATQPRSQAGRQSNDDVVVDATNDCLFLIHITQWSGPLLDDFQCLRNSDSIFCKRWMGPIIPAIS